MVGTITPVGHGGSRSRWAASLALHALGASVAGAALGAALGGLGRAAGAPWPAGWLLLAVAAAAYALREAGVPVPLPERRRQVPEWWRSFFPVPVAALLYGAGLGAGFFTHLRHGTLLVVALGAAVSGDPAAGAGILAAFGLSRAAAVLIAWGGTSPGRVHGLVHALERIAVSGWPRVANAAALVAVAIVAGRAAGTGGIAQAAAAVLGAAFGWAGLAKVVAPRRWHAALRAYRLGPLERLARGGVPLLEAGVAILVLAHLPTAAGILALGLLAAFSVALVRAEGDRVPCGCFGGDRPRDRRLLLARNAAIAAPAVLALGAANAPGRLTPEPGAWLPILLTGAGILLGAGLIARTVPQLRDARD